MVQAPEDPGTRFDRTVGAGDVSRSIATAFIYLESIDRRVLAAMTPCLTTAQFHALRVLDAEPGANLGMLAERMLCDKANASGIVDRLAAMQLVDRRRDPADRRRVTLTLTSEGHEALVEATHRRTESLQAALSPLTSEEMERTIAHLEGLVSALDRPGAGRSDTDTKAKFRHAS